MRIEYGKKRVKYYDIWDRPVKEGDTVLCNGVRKKVYKTTDGYLGTDATNPEWIARGIACECDYGVYLFTDDDTVELVEEA